ncbi:MAG: hypothetical protein Q4D78_00250 [Neisseria zoodegmatis]|uniref:hypothetical protein n=1 Tax=Neisseria zoodegmatis TaxID=326523 RepID=UPI0026E9C067|nr:hypothetical protein [Neisseria zoodegmatis]MDO5068625.1 hypothetical protein [Neisseria zoodegmatis]
MKKTAGLVGVLLLGACAGGANGMLSSNSIVKSVVDNQCRIELNKRSEWKLVSLVMTTQQQREWEDKICGCASEEVFNHVTTDELIKIANPDTRVEAAASVTAKTVTACVKRLIR